MGYFLVPVEAVYLDLAGCNFAKSSWVLDVIQVGNEQLLNKTFSKGITV